MTFSDAILNIIASSCDFECVETGEKFPAVTETDLYASLREQGWKLPGGGFLWREMPKMGFRVLRTYETGKTYRRVYKSDFPGYSKPARKLSQYQTIYTL